MHMGNQLENDLANHVLNDSAHTPPNPPYVGLCTVSGIEDGTGFTETTYTSYARVAAAAASFSAASGGSKTNDVAALEFPQCTGGTATCKSWVLVNHITNAISLSTLMFYGPLWSAAKDCYGDATGNNFHSPSHGFSGANTVVAFAETYPGGVADDTEYTIGTGVTTDNFDLDEVTSVTSDGFCRFGISEWIAVSNNITPQFATSTFTIAMR